MEGISIRQAVLADLAVVARLFDAYRQFYGQPGNLATASEFLRARFEHGESVVFMAVDAAGAALGFAQLYPSHSSVSLARIFILNDLFVAPSARGLGVGKRLIAAAEEFAIALGAVRLTLSTANTNFTAQALYQSAGWQRDEQFLVYQKTFP